MTLTLELTPEQEKKPRTQAEALEGDDLQTDGADAAASAEHELYHIPAFAGKTLADVLAGRIGTVDSAERNGGQMSSLSENTGESFTEYLLEKRRQGRL